MSSSYCLLDLNEMFDLLHTFTTKKSMKMKNVQPAFKAYKHNKEDIPPGYQQIKCHMIFDIKLGENFRRNAQLVGVGHTTISPSAVTFSLVVSRDSVRIALTISALTSLDILVLQMSKSFLCTVLLDMYSVYCRPIYQGCLILR